jgi:thymidylate kinase
VVGNLPRAYRGQNVGVVDPQDPFVSSLFFNHAAVHAGHPGSARFLFDVRYIEYVMALEEARIYEQVVRTADQADVVIHDRHVLDRRVNAYRAGCPRKDIDIILGYVPPPDLTVLLDLPADLAVERVASRGQPGQDENAADLAQYRELYLSCAAKEAAVLLVDAALPPDEVFDAVLPRIGALLSG